MNVEDHITGGIMDCGFGVRGGVIKQSQGVGVGLFRAFFLLCRTGVDGGDHSGVDHNRIVEESSDDLLY